MRIFDIPKLGEPKFLSPLKLSSIDGDAVCNYVSDDRRIRFNIYYPQEVLDYELKYSLRGDDVTKYINETIEVAGPRERIFFDPEHTSCAIVTCGGLSPGLNNVVRAVVSELYYSYHVKRILGVRYGFAGLNPASGYELMPLHPDEIRTLSNFGGTFLGTSRGNQDVTVMVDELVKNKIDVLFSIGGDGTQRGNYDIFKEIQRRNLPISVIGIPKTIDNDIHLVEKTFGFETAFSKAAESIICAHSEAQSHYNGIGLVKLMGRHSGFIAGYAALALSDVNYVLVPEVPFDLYGPKGFLEDLRKRLERRQHAVIVVAEGAGQEYLTESGEKDESGNKRPSDIGMFLRNEIEKFLRKNNLGGTVKYIDPSYIIRSIPPTPGDALFCSQLGQYAVHAGMSGRTGMLVAWRNNVFVHLPVSAVVNNTKKINPESSFWLSVLGATGQPHNMVNRPRQYLPV